MSEEIKTNSLKPKVIKGDRGEVEQHSISDQIAADKYEAAKKVSASPFKAMKKAKIIFGGTT